MEIYEKLCSVIKEYLEVSDDTQLGEDTSLINLGADSLDMAEIVMELEDIFDIEVPEGAENEIHTIGDAVELVEKLIEER